MFSNSSGLRPILVLTVNLNITVIESVIKTSVRSGSYAHNMKYGVNTSTLKNEKPSSTSSEWMDLGFCTMKTNGIRYGRISIRNVPAINQR